MKYILLCLALIVLPACALFGGDEGPGALPLSELRSAPDTLTLGDQQLVLRTAMWRDFQPISPPEGKPLIALFWIYAADSTALPAGLTADAAWVVNGEEVWDTYFTDEEPPPGEQRPYQLYEVAREGPTWGPQIEVDAVVRVRDGDGASYLLRAPAQRIGRTD